MHNEIVIKSINAKNKIPALATKEELIAQALLEAALVDENTTINGYNASDLLASLAEKKIKSDVLHRKVSIFTQIGNLLLHKKSINDNQLNEAVKFQKNNPLKFGEILVQLGFVNEKQIQDAIEEQTKIRQTIDKINSSDFIDVEINYREPDFEKRAKRKKDIPFSSFQSIETADISEAIVNALQEYFFNEKNSNVHWRSEITGIKVIMDLENVKINDD